MKLSSILIADDHPLLLSGLNTFLLDRNFNVIAKAQDGISAYNSIIKLNPDIAILDVSMPKLTGIEIARKCKKNNIKTKIILITFYKDKALYLESKTLNISGYIFKEFALEEIEECINEVANGTTYFSPKITEFLNIDLNSNSKIDTLTKSEKKILTLIAKNLTTKEISERLFIAPKTIEKHRSNISKKIGLDGKTNSLLIWANENKAMFT